MNILFLDLTNRFSCYSPFFLKALLDNKLSVKFFGDKKSYFLKTLRSLINEIFIHRKSSNTVLIISDLYLPGIFKIAELIFYILIKILTKIKIHLIVHNIKPHEGGIFSSIIYYFLHLFIDNFIVHSKSSADLINKGIKTIRIDFGVHQNEILPKTFPNDPIRIVSFGQIRRYKNFESLIQNFPNDSRYELIITGVALSSDYFDDLKQLTFGRENIQLYNKFSSESELVELVTSADIIAFPYKSITTSGALMYALGYNSIIIASDLPYFNEFKEKKMIHEIIDFNNKKELYDYLRNFRNEFPATFYNSLNKKITHLKWEDTIKPYIDFLNERFG